jgi:hypothetical protein
LARFNSNIDWIRAKPSAARDSLFLAAIFIDGVEQLEAEIAD